jgi:membrane associated rhomboid family serine protease
VLGCASTRRPHVPHHNPSERTPVVTYALIALNLIVFAGYFTLFADEARLVAFFDRWALIPARLAAGEGYSTLVTSMFLHGGLLHIAGNMLFLWVFGDNLEDALGHLGFLAFYLACGVAAALAQALPDPDSTVPMVGASGAVAGVMGGYLLLFPRARVDVLVILVTIIRMITLPAWIMLGFWFALQAFNSYTRFGLDIGGVAHLAHVGGFAAGVLFVLPRWLAAGGPAFWRRTHGHPPHPSTPVRQRPTTIPTVRRRRR